jgi:hypothetical protein
LEPGDEEVNSRQLKVEEEGINTETTEGAEFAEEEVRVAPPCRPIERRVPEWELLVYTRQFLERVRKRLNGNEL